MTTSPAFTWVSGPSKKNTLLTPKISSNSEFIIMLNQASTDLIELSKLLSINETQQTYIRNVTQGSGLIKVGRNMVPFINRFPKDTRLYRSFQESA